MNRKTKWLLLLLERWAGRISGLSILALLGYSFGMLLVIRHHLRLTGAYDFDPTLLSTLLVVATYATTASLIVRIFNCVLLSPKK